MTVGAGESSTASFRAPDEGFVQDEIGSDAADDEHCSQVEEGE